jgi:ComF family protein
MAGWGWGRGRRAANGEAGSAWLGDLCRVCLRWQADGLCLVCLDRFARPRLRCPGCAIGLDDLADPGHRPAGRANRLCGDCLTRRPPQRATLAAVDYAYPWDGLLTDLKFHERLDLAPLLVDLLARAVGGSQLADAAGNPAIETASGLEAVDLVLPVPLATERLRERGYNQAWLLARPLARRLGLPARADLLQRVRATPHQLSLPRAQRQNNVRAAFALAAGAGRHVAGRRIALVDDVMTTGATVEEAALALLRGGAAEVRVWVVARTPRDRMSAGPAAGPVRP